MVEAAQIRMTFTQFDPVVQEVLDGTADAGFIRGDWLDMMMSASPPRLSAQQYSQLKFINLKSIPGYPYNCSTPLGPGKRSTSRRCPRGDRGMAHRREKPDLPPPFEPRRLLVLCPPQCERLPARGDLGRTRGRDGERKHWRRCLCRLHVPEPAVQGVGAPLHPIPLLRRA